MSARLPVFMQEWDTFAETLKVAGGFTLPVERQGKQLVLSGTRDTDLIQRWTDLGGTYAESVTKKTDILVFAPEMATGTKVKKAQGYGIRTVGIDDFLTNVRWYYENQ
jgi:NAD-dependent DNA ligase